MTASITPTTSITPTIREVTDVLTKHYDRCLREHGATPEGMDWGSNRQRLNARYSTIWRAMDLRRAEADVVVLDVGCGCGLFLDYLVMHGLSNVRYIGLDASPNMIDCARRRHPMRTFVLADIVSDGVLPQCDWAVANGLFTEKRDLSCDHIRRFAQGALRRMYRTSRQGIIFNAMTTHVNYKDDTLFYWNPGEILEFVTHELSRYVAVYHDLEAYDAFYCVRHHPWNEAAA